LPPVKANPLRGARAVGKMSIWAREKARGIATGGGGD